MEDDREFPYRAEYARSGRANCRKCKASIENRTLRLAVVVQCQHYDGKIPNWYHFDCFFYTHRPSCVGYIDNFDFLRWEDQEKIKAKLDDNTLKSEDYKIEYDKSGRAMCRGCELKISKGDVRISKKKFDSKAAKRFGAQDQWHHLDCFAQLRTKLKFFESGDKLPLFNELKPEDKELVLKTLPKISMSEDEVDGAPSAKKLKTDEGLAEDTAALKKQNEIFFRYRDQLEDITTQQVCEILDFNHQYIPKSVDERFNHLADMMTFGALDKCSKCNRQKLIYKTGGYSCTSFISKWAKCGNVERDPKRKKLEIPPTVAEEFEFLEKYECIVGKRILPAAKPSVPATPSSRVIVERVAPLKHMSCFAIGKTQKSRENLKKLIEKLGGTWASKINDDLSFVISNRDEVEKCSGKMKIVKDLNIRVVSESFLDECEKGCSLIAKMNELSISPWGANPIYIALMAQPKSRKRKVGNKPSNASTVKVLVKGGVAAVDPDSNLDDVASVYVENEDIYNSTLGLTDIQQDRNSYYKIQLLVSDSDPKRYHVFRSWGRIGTTIGGSMTELMPTLEDAKNFFCNVYYDESRNYWGNRKHFEKKHGYMYPIDIDYCQGDIQIPDNSPVESKLPKLVQDLVQMIFDVEAMKNVMIEFEIDIEKLPLGNLSKSQIEEAYAVLSELQQHDGGIKREVVINATNIFYTLIPHNFGTKKPVLLDNKEIIQSKLEMLESLMEMEIAYKIFKETKEGDADQNSLDVQYSKLKTDITVLENTEEDFELIEKYIQNTHSKIHKYTLQLKNVFKINRHGEDERFNPFSNLHNKKLLWHGSTITNYARILSEGLRIAPPEALISGDMFGKGVYFADMVTKSAKYCRASVGKPGLLLLCQVALGDMYETTSAIKNLPPNKHSIKGIGPTAPDPSSAIIKDGVEIPLGKPVKVTNETSKLFHNEFIVYDVAQIKMEYLVEVKFESAGL